VLTRRALEALLFLPDRAVRETPASAGLAFDDVACETGDGERLHAWWVPADGRPVAHVLLCHGNAGNIGDRILHAQLLHAAGLDVLLFDYRGYGRSTGRATEAGTYRDARAARAALLRRPGVDASRLLYLGESVGGAVALELAGAHPPAGLILLSAFTSVRDMARRHYPIVPAALVPDAYPSLRRIPDLRAPLLLQHGDEDDIVPLIYGEELYEAAPEPKRIRVFRGAGHNDLLTLAGPAWAESISAWVSELPAP
jgi:fermentation-respiration switch protein FrsA (DUF1100 family)